MKRWIAITILIAAAVFSSAWLVDALRGGPARHAAAAAQQQEQPSQGEVETDRPAEPPVAAEEPAQQAEPTPAPEAPGETQPQRQTPDRQEPAEAPYWVAAPQEQQRGATLGSDDPTSAFRLRVNLSHWGAAVHQIHLSRERQRIDGVEPYLIQREVEVGNEVRLPFAARSVDVNGQRILGLDVAEWGLEEVQHSENEHSATYSIIIHSTRHRPMLRIERRYVLRAGRYHVDIEQTITNFTSREMDVRWRQHGQADLDEELSYLPDQRRFTSAHFDMEYDPARRRIYNARWFSRSSVLDTQNPDEFVDSDRHRTVWVAALNRYFALVVFRPLREDVQEGQNPVQPLDDLFRVEADIVRDPARPDLDPGVMLLLTSREFTLGPTDGPDASRRLDIEVYAGPRKRSIFNQSPYAELELDHLLRYEIIGCCTWCTFQWLARGLLSFLRLIESVTGDWAVAIIVLVLTVRLLLHPITKKSQMTMTKMGKQMQALQPELKKLKEKYKDDPKQFQQEQMRLFKEKGVNPLNMLGCLPMFLQMPIWIALWAMLYFAVELRHEPAFYGVFQNLGTLLGNAEWGFLADLSEPDMLIRLGDEPVPAPLCGFPISPGINILPILMGIFFYLQSKFTTPPAATPEQAQQQKMMRFMMLLFPLFLYSAPAGLTLYMLVSALGGMLEGMIVRKNIRRMEEDGTLFAKAKPKEGGFMDRLQKLAEQKQKEMAARQKQAGGGGGSKGSSLEAPPRRGKKRKR